MKPHGLSGYICVRNAISLDYCFREVIASLLPICDEVVACDSESSDGTREALVEWAAREPKIRVIDYPWPNPHGAGIWFLTWANWTRQFLKYDMQIFSDADEVLCPKSHGAILEAVRNHECRWVHRLNFWKDNRHLTNPPDWYVGVNVARIGPSELEMTSDEPRAPGEIEMQTRAKHDPTIRVFHYGFIRPQAAYLAKAKAMHSYVRGFVDPLLLQAESTGVPWHSLYRPDVPLLEYNERDHPPVAWDWLRKCGYEAP